MDTTARCERSTTRPQDHQTPAASNSSSALLCTWLTSEALHPGNFRRCQDVQIIKRKEGRADEKRRGPKRIEGQDSPTISSPEFTRAFMERRKTSAPVTKVSGTTKTSCGAVCGGVGWNLT
ncbi:hypothetical protein RRG08_014892 [Elysia crispata]|uniref:Uncharacterized protein n=1 Tax=Elysia crispata TaxID=231223 RepID=A0AAE0ZLV4_9GAST|nr:hypothetical protein RRG08_014892 [Elysia crispata]